MPETLKLPPAEVRRRLEQGENVTVLDARGRSAHARSGERIEGDLRVEGTRGLAAVLAQLPRGWILAYCTWLDDGLAARVAAKLREEGFPDAWAIERGLAGCAEAGLRIVPKC